MQTVQIVVASFQYVNEAAVYEITKLSIHISFAIIKQVDTEISLTKSNFNPMLSMKRTLKFDRLKDMLLINLIKSHWSIESDGDCNMHMSVTCTRNCCLKY